MVLGYVISLGFLEKKSKRFSVCCLQADGGENGVGESDRKIVYQRAKARGPGAMTSKGRRCLSQLQKAGHLTPLLCFCLIRALKQSEEPAPTAENRAFLNPLIQMLISSGNNLTDRQRDYVLFNMWVLLNQVKVTH